MATEKRVSICSALLKLNHSSSHPLGAFEKLSTDAINHILQFLGGDVRNMKALNVEFHTIVQTTNGFRSGLKERCDQLIKKVALITPAIKETEDTTFDTLYSIIMKEPMTNIEKLDKIMKKCRLFLHSAILDVLCQLQLFESHYKDELKDELLQSLVKKFIYEVVGRLTEITSTFACIIDMIANKKPLCDQLMAQMVTAHEEVVLRTEDGTLQQQSILMRIAATVTTSWNLMNESRDILMRHEAEFEQLCLAYQCVSAVYRQFIEARVTTLLKPKEFDYPKFMERITKIIDKAAQSVTVSGRRCTN